MLAIDVQPFFKAPEPLVNSINRAAKQVTTAATVFIHDEEKVPYRAFIGTEGPKEKETSLVQTDHVFYKNGYHLPADLMTWLKEQAPDEVLVVGGQVDPPLLAAGMCLFDAKLKPCLVPQLCYGNEWYQHTVTMNIWERSLGPVYEYPVEIGLTI